MKTLVIHPQDETTEMLSHIYEGRDYMVVRNPDIGKESLRSLIQTHDKIIMLGHGLPEGLINPLFKLTRKIDDLYLIDDSFADLLKSKETISIWCFSDQFFKKHGIPGFHTGMIISETIESIYMLGRCPLSEHQLADNMIRFSKTIGACIEKTPQEMKEYILSNYEGDDEITRFNRNNIIVLA